MRKQKIDNWIITTQVSQKRFFQVLMYVGPFLDQGENNNR